ncbi:MAG: cytochrome c biogenesis protein ResB [Chthoniobacteraceae bacterium]
MASLWKILTSLRLTVWLLGISVLLVFLGSIAQAPEGLWNAQVRWFKSLVVIRQAGDDWWVPPIFPGGHLLGGLLLLNLLAAHFKRFQFNFQKFGIQLTHFGIIVLLIGQFITDKTATESVLQFQEGEARNFTESHRDVELVFLREKDDGTDEVVSFPEALVRKTGELRHEKMPFTVRVSQYGVNGEMLSLSELPGMAENVKRAISTLDGKFSSVEALTPIAEADSKNPDRAIVWRKALKAMGEDGKDIVASTKKLATDPKRAGELLAKVKQQFRGDMLDAFKQMGERERRFGSPRSGSEMAFAAELEESGRLADASTQKPVATNGSGKLVHIVNRPEIKDDKMGRNFQWAILEIAEGDKSLGTWLASARLNPQELEVDGKKWRFALRNERYYLPYSVQLVRAKQEVYQGTSQAKEFASRVLIDSPATGEKRETDITMNNPLRYAGLTFYQSTMDQADRGPGTAALLEALSGRPRSDFAGMEEKEGGRLSGLQVVENPSMLAPYTGCLLVGFGMLWQFLFHLTGFLAKRGGLPSPSFGVPHALLPLCAVLIMVPDVFLAWIAIKNGTLFALAVVSVTPFIRGVLAWQVWRGKYLVFAMVLLLVPTVLAVPFALKYQATHGGMLWPVSIAQFIAFLGIAFVVFSNRPRLNPALA